MLRRSLLTLLLLSLSILLWLLFSASGLRFLVNQVPGVEIQSLKGRLWGQADFAGVSFENDAVAVTFEKASINWQPSALLFSRKLKIKTLELDRVQLTTRSQQPSASKSNTTGLELPLDFDIEEVDLRTFKWREEKSEAQSPEQSIDLIKLSSLEGVGSTLTIGQAIVRKQATLQGMQSRAQDEFIDVSGQVDLALRKQGVINLRAKHQLGPSIGLEQSVVGSLSIIGSWDKLQLDYQTSGQVDAAVSGELTTILTKPNWAIDVFIKPVTVLSEQQVALATSINLIGSIEESQISGDFQLLGLDKQVTGRVLGKFNEDKLTLEQLSLGEDASFASVVGQIRDLQSAEPKIDVNASWSSVAELGDLLRLDLPESTGRFAMQGPLSMADFNLNFGYSSADFPELVAEVSGQVGTQGFQTDQISINSEQFVLQGGIDIRQSDSGYLFALNNIAGSLRDQSLAANGTVELSENEIIVTGIEATIGAAQVSSSGVIGENSDLSWNLSIPEFEQLHPAATGQLVSQGKLLGSIRKPLLDLAVDANGLSYNDWQMGRINGDIRVSFDDESQWRGGLAVSNLRFSNRSLFDSAQLSVTGTLAKHTVTLSNADQNTLSKLSLQGGLKESDYNFEFRAEEVSSELANQFLQDQPFALNGQFNLVSSGQLLSDGKLELQSRVFAPSFTILSKKTGVDDLILADIDVELSSKQQRTKLDGGFTVDGEGHVRIDATVDAIIFDESFQTAPLQAKLDVSYPDLSGLNTFLPSDLAVFGSLTNTSLLSGSLSEPKLEATLALEDGRLLSTTLGSEITNIEMSATTTQDNALKLQFQGAAGEGSVAANAILEYENDIAISANISTDRALLLNSTDLRAVLNSEIAVSYQPNLIDVSGSVSVVEADLHAGETLGVVQESPDLVILSEQQSAKYTRVKLDIELALGEQTRLTASGLTGRLTGATRLNMSTAGQLNSVGELSLKDGQYTILGETFKVLKGRAFYSGGDISNPGLDVEAGKVVDSVTAGIRIQGTAEDPIVSLFSDPALSDQDILAMLFFEKRVDQISTTDAIKLVSIANSIWGSGSTGPSRLTQMQNSLADTLAETLGVNSFDIDIDSSGDSQVLALNSQINSRLKLGYAYNFLNSLQSLFLSYKLTEKWSIRSSIDAESGADLVYKAER